MSETQTTSQRVLDRLKGPDDLRVLAREIQEQQTGWAGQLYVERLEFLQEIESQALDSLKPNGLLADDYKFPLAANQFHEGAKWALGEAIKSFKNQSEHIIERLRQMDMQRAYEIPRTNGGQIKVEEKKENG